jgi:hypothetical protein
LRTLKQHVHTAFDPIWRGKSMTRSQAYRWLAEGIGMRPQDCHVGLFTPDMCRAALAFIESNKVRPHD